MLPLLTEDKNSRLIGCVYLNTVPCYYCCCSWQYLATTLLGSFWRIIQGKRQEEDKDRRIWNNRRSLSLFFYIVRWLSISAQALSREYHRAWAFPYPSSYIRMYILYSCTCSLAVDNFSCRAFILQKLSFSKVFLPCLIR